MLNSKDVGCVIRRFRKEKGLSQEVVANLADIGRTHLSAIERGERRPTLETFFRLSEALGASPSVIIAAIEEERKKSLEQEENDA